MSKNLKTAIVGLVCFAICGLFFYLYNLVKIPTVSVVMPVYNREKLVPRAIESILNQTYKDFEFIIVDDGSTDKTPQILKDYAAYDKRIRIITNFSNRGIPFARNRGINAARGKYIATMDSDDYSVPERLAKSIHFFKDHPEVDALTGGLVSLEEGMTVFPTPDRNLPGDSYRIYRQPGHYEIDLCFDNQFFNVASIFKRSFILKHHIQYDLAIKTAEDYDFWVQFVKNKAIMASVIDAFTYVRWHSENPSSYYEDMVNNSKEIHQKCLSYYYTPDKEDILFGYSTFERCHILAKMSAANKKNKRLPQKYFNDYMKKLCPTTKHKYIFLVHPFWESYLEEVESSRWNRIGTDVYAAVEFKDDKIDVHWEKWPMESFVMQNGKYLYVPGDRKVFVRHKNWEDNLLMDNNNHVCTRETIIDYCTYEFADNENTLRLNWKYWGEETLVKDPKTGNYVPEKK